MPIKLPLEIVERIVRFLPNNDLIQCLLACKVYYVSFYPALVRSVTIQHKRKLKQFFCILVQHNLGLYVRELYLKNRVGITKQDFEFLSQHCPYVEILKFNDWRHCTRSTLASFKQLKQLAKIYDTPKASEVLLDAGSTLTHLELSQRVVRALTVTHTLLPLLSLGTQLTHLTLDGYFSPSMREEQLNFDHVHWDTLHRACPHLVYIQMLTVHLTATLPQVKHMTENIDVVDRIKTLILSDLCLDHPVWLIYLAIKYPQLTTLELRFELTAFTNYDESEEKLSRAGCSAAFLGMANQLTQLKTLSLQGLKDSHFPGVLFFDTLAQKAIQLQDLIIRYNTDIFLQHGLNERVLSAIVAGQSHSIKSIHMDMWVKAHDHFFDFLRPLSLCSQLVDLSLASDEFGKFNFNPIPIDMILDMCVHLKKLELIRTALVIEDKHTVKRTHPLKSLRIAISRVSEALFCYLTRRCPSISHLEVVTSYWMPREIQMRIDMPNNQFDYVRISDLNKLNVPCLEGNLSFGTSVNLFGVHQLDLIDKQKARYEQKGKQVQQDLTSWYHLYEIEDQRRLRYPPCFIRRLHPEEVKSFKYLVKFYQENYYREQPGTTGFIVDRYVSKKDWRDDVRFGHVLLTCKSVKIFKYNYNVIDWSKK
ncbi:uncharacterized protein B0P05DRAFT_543850 [Gilbertella persicaria]|uniref:uncharacterized protein n=1 Tax=Gilbertella persicaria TaxID=101096 RepID=UPI00221EE75E|nr:uncharacterized protein B0P05DRAFT_543850 [Gilbertella persicaria]KAI8078028.1 hypothetical protein B0P05DRAFT_543850 [Gilbertella persicaria]